MALSALTNKFSGRAGVIGSGVAALSLAFSPIAATAQDNVRTQPVAVTSLNCSNLEEINGMLADSSISASRFSEQNVGGVGIATRPGSDMSNTPEVIKQAISGSNLEAECFVNNQTVRGGTQFSFFVLGQPVEYDGQVSFGINDLMNNKAILRSVVSQATLARASMASQTLDAPDSRL